MAKPKYYVTTPVYNAATAPQAGFLYSSILCDAIARHWRNCGFEVAHFVGVDAHDGNLEGSGEQPGSERAVSVQRNYGRFEAIAKLADIHHTRLGRLASDDHIHAVQSLLRRTMHRSHLAIYQAAYEGRYCSYDQIDVSQSAEPADCALCGRAAELISEKRYFFRLSAFRNRLMALYKYHPEFVQPPFRGHEIAHLVHTGLKDIPISGKRTEHGIPWPDDPDHIVSGRYSELVSYLSAIGFGKNGFGSDEFQSFWPANVHVVAADALISHAVWWPAFLMAADLPVPRHIVAHGTVHVGQEASGNNVSPEEMLQAVGGDALRYCLLREVPYGENTQLRLDGLVTRYNADLARSLAGLTHRLISQVVRHCDGKIPHRSLLTGLDFALEIASKDMLAEARFLFDKSNFSEGLSKIWSLLKMIDNVLEVRVPRELVQEPGRRQELTNSLHDACESLGLIALFLHPVLPRATRAIWKSLGQTRRLEDQLVDMTPWGFLRPGTPVVRLDELFPAVDEAHR